MLSKSSWILPKLTVINPPPSINNFCRSFLSLHRSFLSWLLIDPPSITNFMDPFFLSLHRSFLSWLLIDPPSINNFCGSFLRLCRSFLSWLSINPLPSLPTYKFQPLCRSSLSWLSINPPPLPPHLQISTSLQILSELTVNQPPHVDQGTINRFWAKFFTFQPNHMPCFTEDIPIGESPINTWNPLIIRCILFTLTI